MIMECTQRLECTQIYETHTERVCPEQIGFLGICGKSYPVVHGPNKIGRDPQTCNIVLNLNSVSRQHAVINILNKHDFMLMDLDSANKTKLLNNTLLPYIPQPLKNGDTVQFGEIFGIFRLLEDNNELPMTQAMDVPETPVFSKHMSRLNKAPITTVPESPDVSDRDDSFILVSQSTDDKHLKSTNNHNFIRPASKTISIQPVGSNKIDNVFWNSSKKSTSLSCSLNDSFLSSKSDKSVATPNIDAIFDMETQPPLPNKVDTSSHSIYTADTQIPGSQKSPLIHSLETQLQIPPNEHLPEVCKIHNQQEMHFDLCLANKENEKSIFNAETQMFSDADKVLCKPNNTSQDKDGSTSKEKSNVSDEELLFDEVDNEFLEEDFGSQALLPQDTSPKSKVENDAQVETIESHTLRPKVQPKKRSVPLKSDSSTDCEDFDIALTQKLPEKKECDDDDITDCEDDIIELNADKFKRLNHLTKSNIEIDLDDAPTQIIPEVKPKACSKDDLEDLPTQVIAVPNASIEVDLADLPTQVIVSDKIYENAAEQFSEEMIKPSPFKIPQSSIKVIRKDISKVSPNIIETKISENADDVENYYANTQELYGDLDSQREFSPEIVTKSRRSGGSDSEDKVQKFVSNLNSQQIRDVIGVAKVRKLPSDCSDVDVTPTKVRPFRVMDIDLPNSQEIKTIAALQARNLVAESSSESDVENNSEDQNTPILFKKKKKLKPDVVLDLTKKFDVASLPSRIITRVRKPTIKMQEDKRKSKHIKPIFMAEQEDNVDNEIIHENLLRLRNHDKSKNSNEKISDENKNKLNVKEIIPEMKVTKRKETDQVKNERDTKNQTAKKMDTHKDKTTKIDSLDKTTKNKSKHNKVQEESVLKTNESIEEEEKQSSTSSRRSMRSSRIKRINEKASKSPEKEVSKSEKNESKPKRTYKKKETKRVLSPEDTQVRRSNRQRAVKEKKVPPIKIKLKSILKTSNSSAHDQSTVYNISSGTDSPKGIKRSAADDSAVPSPKRIRSAATSNTTLRTTPARVVKTQYVLFTAFPSDKVSKKLEKLGAEIVTDVSACTVVLTLQIRRTFKLLCALGLGKPIVGPSWVQACADTNMILDPWNYLIRDEVTEKRFGFDLEKTLRGKRNFLKGYNVSSTPNVTPNASEMKLIVECSGGTWKEGSPNWVCLSSKPDKALWPSLRRKGATIVSNEFILGGVLKQKLDIQNNRFL